MMKNIGGWCADYLLEEEGLLVAALPMVRDIQIALVSNDLRALPQVVDCHQEFMRFIDAMHERRQRFSAELARYFRIAPESLRLSQLLASVPTETHAAQFERLNRVRAMAEELVALNHRLSVHLRIHLDAYQRLLRDLTGTATGSGRYGAHGQSETSEYRALIQIHG